ncbi:MAG: transporter substrate-binding domain-containing protein [Lentisphaeraceae bacterium]|nr:transporter substrate-binding domain-containing protein [Lentisphaeraceae bacterium]
MNKLLIYFLSLVCIFTSCKPREDANTTSQPDSSEQTSRDRLIKISTVKTAEEITELITLIKSAYAKVGYKTELIFLPSQRSLEENQTNPDIDAELGRAKAAASMLPESIRIPVPVFKTESSCFVKDKSIKIESVADLSKYTVCTIRGFPIVENAVKDFSPQVVTTIDQAMRVLNEGRVQIVVAVKILGEHALKNLQINDIFIAGPPVTEHKIYHYINKRHKALVPGLTKALSELSGNAVEKD